ncbi:unnamed protein product [Durusdinium trenchii]|uniref:Glyoxalase domain-containing protein 4 n=1 Tax=Durusdinium trenchii TaxID=1381693 RepID=A0ABP0M7C6_9DINO
MWCQPRSLATAVGAAPVRPRGTVRPRGPHESGAPDRAGGGRRWCHYAAAGVLAGLVRGQRPGHRARTGAVVSSMAAQDMGILLIEHLNLNVSSTEIAVEFYEALGCCRDERRPLTKTLHSNCGALTQFHTPSPENEAYIADAGPQRWRGTIHVAYDSPAMLEAERFASTDLTLGEWQEDLQELSVLGPYGNRFLLHVAPAKLDALGPRCGARPGSEKSRCLGMDALTLEVPVGTAKKAALFYKEVLGCAVRDVDGCADGCAVLAGPGLAQELRFQEVEGCSGKEVGEHMAIYVNDFEGCFQRLLERGLVWVNPRFVHLDKSTTLEEALHYSCFRFKDVVDETGSKLFELEHEVRSTSHKSWPLAGA